MKRVTTLTRLAIVALGCVVAESANAQQVLFEENFESGSPSAEWSPYLDGEESVEAVDPSFAAEPLATSGSSIGYLQDADGSYTGAAIALAGNNDLSDYSIEGDVYCYVNPPTGSAYTGLVVYADETTGTYVKLASDFDADKRIRLYNNRVNTSTFEYTFHHPFNAGDVPGGIPTSDGWHRMKVEVRTINPDTTAYWCYFDGELLVGSPIYDTGNDRVSQGRFGLFSFQQSGEGIPGYYDNIVVKSLAPASSIDDGSKTKARAMVLDNHPNPFHEKTILTYSLDRSGFVAVMISDLMGKPIRTIRTEYEQAGEHVATWSGDDEFGTSVPAGIYVCRLFNGETTLSRTIVLVR